MTRTISYKEFLEWQTSDDTAIVAAKIRITRTSHAKSWEAIRTDLVIAINAGFPLCATFSHRGLYLLQNDDTLSGEFTQTVFMR
jgi:hypothetical protein